jgi:DNA-binding PucR family transcriptional regulator
VLVILPVRLAKDVVGLLAPGFVVTGPVVTDLSQATESAQEALAALIALPAWPAAPNPVSSDELLPERALSGDSTAARRLVDLVHTPLQVAGRDLVETVACFLEDEGSIEATARHLYVHANTVRYRLQRAADLTGLRPSHPREGFVLRCALLLARLQPVTQDPEL